MVGKKYNAKRFKPKSLDRGSLPKSDPRRQDRGYLYLGYVGPRQWRWISFPYKGIDMGIESILPSSEYPQITKIKTSGFDGSYASMKYDGVWSGSITTIDPKRGYEIFNDSDETVHLEITTPGGYGSLYGDADLKWDLQGGLNQVATPFFSFENAPSQGGGYHDDLYQNEGEAYHPIDSALAFTNHGQSIAGGGTGEILEKVLGEGQAMDYIDNEWVGSIAHYGFRHNSAYFFDVKNQPSSEPFRYFKDPVIHPYDYSENQYFRRFQEHPIEGVNWGNFLFDQGDPVYQNLHGGWTMYKWAKGNTLTRPTPQEDWIGVYRGDVCVGSHFILTDDWTANTNGGIDSYADLNQMAFLVSLQSKNGPDGDIHHNCHDGDLVRYLFYDASTEEYLMCKWYDTVTQKVLEWEDPLGDGAYENVSKYMFQTAFINSDQGQFLDGQYPHTNQTFFYGDAFENALNYTEAPLVSVNPGFRFALVAVPYTNTDGTKNTWYTTNQ